MYVEHDGGAAIYLTAIVAAELQRLELAVFGASASAAVLRIEVAH